MKKDDNKENIKVKKEEETDLKDFDFILKRSKKEIIIKDISEPVKKINYTYSREESYSDDIIFHLTQLNDKINQYKYKYYLSNSNKNNNFQVYELNITTDIDVFYEYESFKNDIYNNVKSYNLHEHRKVPFGVENKHGRRRNYKHFEENKFQRIGYNLNNRRSVSVDKYNKNRNNYITDIEKNNNDKVMYGGINKYKNFQNNDNNNDDNDNDDNDNDNDDGRMNNNKKFNKRKDYCTRLTTYDPFHKKKKKKFKDDDSDN